jgi:hypothetical protein
MDILGQGLVIALPILILSIFQYFKHDMAIMFKHPLKKSLEIWYALLDFFKANKYCEKTYTISRAHISKKIL